MYKRLNTAKSLYNQSIFQSFYGNSKIGKETEKGIKLNWPCVLGIWEPGK